MSSSSEASTVGSSAIRSASSRRSSSTLTSSCTGASWVSSSIDPSGASRTAVEPPSDGRADTVVSNGPIRACALPPIHRAMNTPTTANAATFSRPRRRSCRPIAWSSVICLRPNPMERLRVGSTSSVTCRSREDRSTGRWFAVDSDRRRRVPRRGLRRRRGPRWDRRDAHHGSVVSALVGAGRVVRQRPDSIDPNVAS
jgi:hypothetical protein